MGFLRCFLYLTFIGCLAFAVGRLIPENRPDANSVFFRQLSFEPKLYGILKVRKWQNKLPDMSRILPGAMPQKNLSGDYRSRLSELIHETCVAELIHFLLIIAGLQCIRLWEGAGGFIITLIFSLGNVPFIMIQRNNRPRLVHLYEKNKKEERENALSDGEMEKYNKLIS